MTSINYDSGLAERLDLALELLCNGTTVASCKEVEQKAVCCAYCKKENRNG